MADKQNIHNLRIDNQDIILIGTAHISHKSVTLVQEQIAKQKPDAVAIELCQSRYESITKDNKWENMNLWEIIKQKKTTLLIVNLLLSSFQHKLAKKFNIRPGAEMIKAIECAKQNNCQIILIDRDVKITLLRTINSIGFWGKLKLFSNGFGSFFSKEEISQESIDQLTNNDQLVSMLQAMNQNSPKIKKSLIDERDLYMIEKIRQSKAKKIVAIVGAGHTVGMKKNLTTPVDIAELETIPPKRLSSYLIQWTIPLLIATIFIGAWFWGEQKTLQELGIIWIVSNALFCALGAIFSLAHPITIITALVCAPITSLHPMVGAGMICGLIELYLRKPLVKDFNNLLDDVATLAGWRKNTITRILIVMIFTSIGSAIGTVFALHLFTKVL